jgi:glycosyltransferase involved in cell wall biosynthesis
VAESRFEVVIINDGTPDDTMRIVDDFAIKYSNIKIRNKENGGVSSARNMGIDCAEGKYVLFLDADDELNQDSLKVVIDYLDSHETMDMLVTRQIRNNGCEERMVGAPNLKEHSRYTGLEAYRCRYIRVNAGGGVCNVGFLKTNGLKFPEGIRNGEDTIFFGYLQMFAQSIVYLNQPVYKINEDNESASRGDYAIVGRRFAITVNEVGRIRKNIIIQDSEKKAIFDYVAYQLLSNTTHYFTKSRELSYKELKRTVRIKDILPLDTRNMYCMKRQAQLMNFSFSLYYFFYWIKSLVVKC